MWMKVDRRQPQSGGGAVCSAGGRCVRRSLRPGLLPDRTITSPVVMPGNVVTTRTKCLPLLMIQSQRCCPCADVAAMATWAPTTPPRHGGKCAHALVGVLTQKRDPKNGPAS